jgi:hypothetical protein
MISSGYVVLGLGLLGCRCRTQAGATTDASVAHLVSSGGGSLVARTGPGDPPSGPAAPSFPGAEGFGATATGGRGGVVCEVTTLAAEGAGSLRACIDLQGPRTVVFRVSGVIPGVFWIQHGDLTLAGQTSPGGVVIHGGIVCDNIYERYACRNVILRHLRLRGAEDDTLRLAGAERVMVDHLSFAGATDESIEISRTHDVTVQWSVIAEPVGSHYQFGGILVNYSRDRFPLDGITLHHNVWNGVFGRLPELSCEENPDGEGRSNCAGRTLHIELSNNLVFDGVMPVYYNRCPGTGGGNECRVGPEDFRLALNWVGNVMVRRRGTDQPMFVPDIARGGNDLYYTDNFQVEGTTRIPGTADVPSRAQRHPYPAVTLDPAQGLQAQLQRRAGAFPRDPMDTRLMGYLSAPADQRPPAWGGEGGIDRRDAFRVNTPAPAAPPDRDHDGMPDAWEAAHGLDPATPDGNGRGLSRALLGADGYTNLECYLQELAVRLVGE